MKKKIVLCTVMALTAAFIFGGCGKQTGGTGEKAASADAEDSNNAAGAESSDDDGYVYVPEYRTLGSAGNNIGRTAMGKDGNIFYLEYAGDKTKLVSMNIDSQETAEVPVALEENQYITSLNMSLDGNLLVGLTRYNADVTAAEQILIKTLDTAGGELASLVQRDFTAGAEFLYFRYSDRR